MQRYEAGDQIEVWRNQAYREAVVLAVVDDKMIVEYEMPAGTSQLLVGKMDDDWEGRETVYSIKPISYASVPRYWRKAIKDQSGGWIGKGQTQPHKVEWRWVGRRRKPVNIIEPARLL